MIEIIIEVVGGIVTEVHSKEVVQYTVIDHDNLKDEELGYEKGIVDAENGNTKWYTAKKIPSKYLNIEELIAEILKENS